MPNYEFKDINKEVVEGENYAPNKVKTTEQTNKKIRSKAEVVTKVVENIVSAIETNDNVKEKIQAGISSLLCNILSVPEESDVKKIGDPNLILLTKTMKENLGKSMETLGDFYDKVSSLKKAINGNKIESEDVVSNENIENSNDNENLNVSVDDEKGTEDENFSNNFNGEDISTNQEQEFPEMPIVETEEPVDDRELTEMPSFDQSFDWSNDQEPEVSEPKTEEPIVNDDIPFDFSAIGGDFNLGDSSISPEINEDDSLKTEMIEQQSPNVEPEADNSISNNAYTYSNGAGSSQLYNECSRLSYIVNSYAKQAEQFEEEFNNEQAEIERLKEQIAVHEENQRNIKANQDNAYSVYMQAKEELKPIIGLLETMGNQSFENDNSKHRGM